MTVEYDNLNDDEFACLIFRSCGASRYIESALSTEHKNYCRLCSGKLVSA